MVVGESSQHGTGVVVSWLHGRTDQEPAGELPAHRCRCRCTATVQVASLHSSLSKVSICTSLVLAQDLVNLPPGPCFWRSHPFNTAVLGCSPCAHGKLCSAFWIGGLHTKTLTPPPPHTQCLYHFTVTIKSQRDFAPNIRKINSKVYRMKHLLQDKFLKIKIKKEWVKIMEY